MMKNLDKILSRVQKATHYCGGELNEVIKNPEEVDIRFAFAFPDTYEVGMSHLGMKILYHVLNQREDTYCERVFAPWIDMEEEMRKENVPLFSNETKTPIKEFDFLGITLQYEMCYSNILNMLALSDIPLLARDRGEDDPFVNGGGPCSYNSEPIADFFDLFNIGEGEDMLPAIVRLYIQMKEEGRYTRKDFLHEAAIGSGL